MSVTGNPNTTLDVTDFWDQKIKALHFHESQIDNVALLDERIRNRLAPGGTLENPKYEEKFRRIKFR
jgi:LmbE family N-acetylglucosaminyl deacetylase